MSERIFLTYTNASAIPYQGTTLGHHIVLNYVDSEGRHHTLEGMPEHQFHHNLAKLGAAFQEEVISNGVKNRDSQFQRLSASANVSRRASDPAFSRPHTLIAEGDDLRSQWERMTKFGDEVNTIGYEYRPLSQNSNSFAAGALKRGGFLGPGTVLPEIFDRLFAVDPASGQTYRMEVRGFDQHLANPQDETAPPLQRSGMPFVPANARAAANGHESFDRRFGSAAAESANSNLPAWMSDVGEILRNVDRKPAPYLGRRVAGKPEPSTFDEGTSAVPFVPSNEVLSSDRPSSLDGRFGNWTTSPGGSTPRNPNLPLPPAEPGKPPGIFNDKPIPLWVTPPPIQGSTDLSEALGTSAKPMRYVSRRDGNPPPASVSDTGAPAARFVLPDQLNNASGDRTDWAAALAGLAAPPQRRSAFVSGSDVFSRAVDDGRSLSRPGQSQGPTASALLEYIRHLNQLNANTPQVPTRERASPGASLAPSDGPAPMGLPGRLAAFAGIDPDNPDQLAPPVGGLLARLLAIRR